MFLYNCLGSNYIHLGSTFFPNIWMQRAHPLDGSSIPHSCHSRGLFEVLLGLFRPAQAHLASKELSWRKSWVEMDLKEHGLTRIWFCQKKGKHNKCHLCGQVLMRILLRLGRMPVFWYWGIMASAFLEGELAHSLSKFLYIGLCCSNAAIAWVPCSNLHRNTYQTQKELLNI